MGATPSDQLATVRDPSSALALADSLPGVSLAQVSGVWRGVEVPTGHPMDGLLERYGWWGKDLRDPERAPCSPPGGRRPGSGCSSTAAP